MVRRDVFTLGGATLSIRSTSYQPAYVYHQQQHHAPAVRYYNSPTRYYTRNSSPIYFKQWTGIPRQQKTVTTHVTVPHKEYRRKREHRRHDGKHHRSHERRDHRDHRDHNHDKHHRRDRD